MSPITIGKAMSNVATTVHVHVHVHVHVSALYECYTAKDLNK